MNASEQTENYSGPAEGAGNTPVNLRIYKAGNIELLSETEARWVRYEDHVGAFLNPLGNPLTRDDHAAFTLMQNILDVIAECETSEHFRGFQIQESRDSDGLLLAVRLVPCDDVGGIISPRTV